MTLTVGWGASERFPPEGLAAAVAAGCLRTCWMTRVDRGDTITNKAASMTATARAMSGSHLFLCLRGGGFSVTCSLAFYLLVGRRSLYHPGPFNRTRQRGSGNTPRTEGASSIPLVNNVRISPVLHTLPNHSRNTIEEMLEKS